MSEQERSERLSDAIESVAGGGARPSTGDAEVDGLTRLATALQGLPDPAFKARLRSQLLPRGGTPRFAALWDALRGLSERPSRWRLAALASAAFTAGVVVVVGATLLALLVAGGDGEDERQVELPEAIAFALAPADADATGVELDTEFVITSDQPTDVDTIRSLLQVEPAVGLAIEEEDAQRYVIAPAAALEPGRIYHFSLAETAGAPRVVATWAFQTKSPIAVVQTLPRDQGTGVPLNTGIELTFSHEGVQDIAEHFQIEPPVEGRFEVHKRVVVFVPADELAPGTLYTVTVRSGLAVAGTTDVMEQDFVFQFETGDTTRTGAVPVQPIVSFSRRTVEASTLEAPALQLYTSQQDDVTLGIEVYRYPDLASFLSALEAYQRLPNWAQITRDSYAADTAGLERVAAFEPDVQRLDPYSQAFIVFPEPLSAGFYLVDGDFEGRAVQTWLQVTDVATYVTLDNERILAWVNDLQNRAPLSGARVEVVGTNATGQTDAQGTALLEAPATLLNEEASGFGYVRTNTSGNLLVTAPDGRQAVVPLSANVIAYDYGGYRTFGYRPVGDDYWHYVSTDRPLYLPGDTVRFWGVVRHREEPKRETLTIELTGSDYLDYYYRPVRIAELEVTTSALGTFSGELTFAGLSPGYYQLNVLAGDTQIDSALVPVETYTKPAYKIEVVPDRKAVFTGEPIDFAVKASFLEGSPVPELRLRYSAKTSSGEITTDEAGEAQVRVTAAADSTSYPSSHYFNAAPVLAEEAEIVGEAAVTVLPADLTITDAATRLEGGQGVIEGRAHHVDLSRLNEGTAQGYDDYLGDRAPGVPVSLRITEVSWRQREVGEYYDFVAKIVRKRYEYDRIETPIGAFSTTSGPEGAFRYAFEPGPDKYYQIELAVTDGSGRRATQDIFLSGSESLFNARSDLVYLSEPGRGQQFFGDGTAYHLGDSVVLEMRRGAELLPAAGENGYLFYKAQNGIRDHVVQAEPTLRFDFSETDVPNTTVLGVWFNGRTYREVSYGYSISFDQRDRELAIEITPDKERYEPGDTATLSVRVTDRSGRALSNAEVNIAVVDEALFLIQGYRGYNLEVLDALYRNVGAGILYTYASHQYPDTEQAAERGGDGGPRQEFADVAFYGQVTTDADGRASVTFDLPDNLTAWRVTAEAFTNDIEAGTSIRSLPVGLPFFVDVTMSDEYLVSDKPVIKVRSFGRALAAGTEVSFSVSAPAMGLTEPARVTAPAFQAARVPLPELRAGEHEVLIEGSAGGLQDSLIRTVRVVPSRLVAGQGNFYELTTGLRIEGNSDGPTRLVFSDHERGRYALQLQRLLWGRGDRVDQMLARDLAAELITTYFEETEARGEPFDAALYQTPDGGIALFPYADDDLALSARVAALAPERVGRTGLAAYFLRVTENRHETRERRIIALYGLAALNEPVLVPLQAALTEAGLTWRERLYLGLAALAAGDSTTAAGVYEGIIADFGESRAPQYRLRVGSDQDDILEATSLAAILGAGLGDARAPALFEYTETNYATDILVELEQISYLQQVLPRLSGEPVRFAYTLNGERQEITLERGESFAIQVTPEELDTIALEPIEGRVGVAALHTAPVEPAELARDPDLRVTRQYGSATGDRVVVSEGELVPIYLDVQFGPQALSGCYQVTDLLPSGLRPVTRPYDWGIGRTWFPYRVDGQRVSFCAWNVPPPPGLERPRLPAYYARVVSAGEYTAEPVVIQSMQSAESVNLSDSVTVEIR